MNKVNISFSLLNSYNIFNVVSTRSWGSINPFVGYESIRRISAGIEVKEEKILARIVFAEQIHDCNVHSCNPSDGGSIRLSVDALISNNPRHVLATYTADCVPLLLYDPQNKIVGVIHAGYKGLAKGVISNTIGALKEQFNTNPSELIVGVSPFIKSCCYEVRYDILDLIKMCGWTSCLRTTSKGLFLDLASIVKNQLLALDVNPEKIEEIDFCTSCRNDLLFSARKRISSDERGSCFVSLISLSPLN